MPRFILGESFPSLWLPLVLFTAGAVWTVARGPASLRALLGLGAGMLFIASVLANTDKIHHLFSLYPIPHLMAGGFLVWLADRYGRRASLVLLGLVLAANAATLTSYYVKLGQVGGYAQWTDALYSLSESVGTHYCDRATLIAVDWGIDLPVAFLTHDRCPTFELFPLLETRPIEETPLRDWLGRPDVVFGVYEDWVMPTYGVGKARGKFRDEIRDRADLNPHVEQFFQGDGTPVLSLVTAETLDGWVRYLADGGRLIPSAGLRPRLSQLGPGIDFAGAPAESALGPGWFPREAPGPFAFRWIGASADLYLRAPEATRLRISGEAPAQTREGQTLEVLINRRSVAILELRPGPFDQTLAISPGADGFAEVRLRPSRTFVPGDGDRRQLGLIMRRIAFER